MHVSFRRLRQKNCPDNLSLLWPTPLCCENISFGFVQTDFMSAEQQLHQQFAPGYFSSSTTLFTHRDFSRSHLLSSSVIVMFFSFKFTFAFEAWWSHTCRFTLSIKTQSCFDLGDLQTLTSYCKEIIKLFYPFSHDNKMPASAVQYCLSDLSWLKFQLWIWHLSV